MSVPGTKNGMYQTNGLEHDESGSPNSLYLGHEKMNAKRYRKLWPIRERYHGFSHYGPKMPTSGSSAGVLGRSGPRGRGRRQCARRESLRVRSEESSTRSPSKDFERFLAGVGELLVIELRTRRSSTSTSARS